MHTPTRIVACLSLLVGALPLTAQVEPPETVTGQYVLQRLHGMHVRNCCKTLTCTQKATRYRRDGAPSVQTWYESRRAPVQTEEYSHRKIDIPLPTAVFNVQLSSSFDSLTLSLSGFSPSRHAHRPHHPCPKPRNARNRNRQLARNRRPPKYRARRRTLRER